MARGGGVVHKAIGGTREAGPLSHPLLWKLYRSAGGFRIARALHIDVSAAAGGRKMIGRKVVGFRPPRAYLPTPPNRETVTWPKKHRRH